MICTRIEDLIVPQLGNLNTSFDPEANAQHLQAELISVELYRLIYAAVTKLYMFQVHIHARARYLSLSLFLPLYFRNIVRRMQHELYLKILVSEL